MSNAWNWIKRNTKFVILILGFIVFFIFFFLFRAKSRAIKSLETKLYELQTTLKLEKLAATYNIAVEEIKYLEKEDAEVEKQIKQLKEDLLKKLPDDMTPEEIAQKFRELGLP